MTIKNAAKLMLLVVSLATTAVAQMPPGLKTWDVLQNGVLVGQLYVEGTGANYVEHWVLWPGYATPGNGVSVEVKQGTKVYANAKEFLGKVQFPSGSKYVKADCKESSTLP